MRNKGIICIIVTLAFAASFGSAATPKKDVISVDVFQGKNLVSGKDDTFPLQLRLGLTMFLNKYKGEKFDVFNSINLKAVAEEQARQENDWYETSVESKGFANASILVTGHIVPSGGEYIISVYAQRVQDRNLASVAQKEIRAKASKIESGLAANEIGIDLLSQLGVKLPKNEEKQLLGKPTKISQANAVAVQSYARAALDYQNGQLAEAQRTLAKMREALTEVSLINTYDEAIVTVAKEINTQLVADNLKNGLEAREKTEDYLYSLFDSLGKAFPFEIYYSPELILKPMKSHLDTRVTIGAKTPVVQFVGDDMLKLFADIRNTQGSEVWASSFIKNFPYETHHSKSMHWIAYRSGEPRYFILTENVQNDQGKTVFTFEWLYAYVADGSSIRVIETPITATSENSVEIKKCDSEFWTFTFTAKFSDLGVLDNDYEAEVDRHYRYIAGLSETAPWTPLPEPKKVTLLMFYNTAYPVTHEIEE